MSRIINQEPKKLLGMLLKRELGVTHRRWWVAVILMSIVSAAYPQQKQPIIYLTPDTVKASIEHYLKESKGKSPIYAILQHEGDTTSILVCTYNKASTGLAYLVRNSNRYIRISSKAIIPVILQADVALSENLHMIKNKGTTNEIMSNTVVLVSGYLIVYKGVYWNVSLIKTEYYQN